MYFARATETVARGFEFCIGGAARSREGDERLSGTQKGEPRSAGKGKSARMVDAGDMKNRRQRTSDVGRALRSAYDDTLRESVPDDFLNLLGKLS